MKKISPRPITAFLGLVALITYVTLSQAEQKPAQPKTPSTSQKSQAAGSLPHGKVKDSLAAFLLCHRDRFKVGEPIPLSHGVINIGPGVEAQDEDIPPPIRVWWLMTDPVQPGNVTWLEVTGPDGKSIPYHGGAIAWRNLSADVEGNSVLLRHRGFVGNVIGRMRGFEMSEPGTYKVRWGYKPFWKGGPWTGELMSNEVQFEIVETTEPETVPPSSTLEDRTIRLMPSGMRFAVPERWVDWYRRTGKNFHLSRADLEKVKSGQGEWDTEYAKVVNVVLPFEKCAAHVGGEDWGRSSVSYADVQMRVYIGEWGYERIQQTVATDGFDEASKLSKPVMTSFKAPSIKHDSYGKWHRSKLSYPVWYGDYGGTANVDFYSQKFGKKTAVLVFMYSDFRIDQDPRTGRGEIRQIIDSFRSK